MPTQLFQQLPWDGGLNLSQDEAMIGPNALTIADNIVMDARGAKRKREGISHDWDDGSSSEHLILGLHDFWHGSTSRLQRMVGVASNRALYSYNAGARTALTDAGTAWSGTLTKASLLTFNNKAIIAVDGAANVMKMWDGSGNVVDVPGSPPKASFLCEHLGRIWCNDKDDPDLLHYCPTGDHTQWRGAGDSGAIPIRRGDGDPVGITAGISWGGELFIFKKTKLYKLVGYDPETMQLVQVSDNLGGVSHAAVKAVDNIDVVFVSEKGIHSLSNVLRGGDGQDGFLSASIQDAFNNDLSRVRLPYIQAAYISAINSMAFAVTEESSVGRVDTTTTVNNALYFYNVKRGTWWRWPDVSCQALCIASDADKKRLYIGTHIGRVSKAFNGLPYDETTAGAQRAIRRRIATGELFVDGSPFTLKAFKRLVLYYKPKGRQTTSVTFRLDDQSLAPENALSFAYAGSGAPLGMGFKLGATPLGSPGVFAAYVQSISGVGRGCKIIIEEASMLGQSDIEGYAIEFEPAGYFYEAM